MGKSWGIFGGSFYVGHLRLLNDKMVNFSSAGFFVPVELVEMLNLFMFSGFVYNEFLTLEIGENLYLFWFSKSSKLAGCCSYICLNFLTFEIGGKFEFIFVLYLFELAGNMNFIKLSQHLKLAGNLNLFIFLEH